MASPLYWANTVSFTLAIKLVLACPAEFPFEPAAGERGTVAENGTGVPMNVKFPVGGRFATPASAVAVKVTVVPAVGLCGELEILVFVMCFTLRVKAGELEDA